MKQQDKISYSQCWEDPELVKKGLSLLPQDNLIIVTSGGDNVLNLSLVGLNEITAIDNNSLQNYLLELKIAAIKKFDYEDCVAFLGLKKDKNRWKKYLNLKKKLTPQAINYWDNHKKYIKQGIMHCGRFEKFVKFFRNFLIPITHNKKTVKKLISFNDVGEQKDFYNKQWLNKRWKVIFNLFFSQDIFSKFGRSKKMFDYCETDKVGECFLKRMDMFFSKQVVSNNYFIHYLFTGNYPTSFYPPYLHKDNFEKIKITINSIEIISADFYDYIDNLDKNKLYKICLSDIFESYSEKRTLFFFNKLTNLLKEGSKFCFWNNLIDRQPKENNQLEYLKEISEKLHNQDRLFFYKKFFVYEKK